MAALGAVKPGPEGSDEFSSSRCRRSRIGGGTSLRSRASSTSPWRQGRAREVFGAVWGGVRGPLLDDHGYEQGNPEIESIRASRTEGIPCMSWTHSFYPINLPAVGVCG